MEFPVYNPKEVEQQWQAFWAESNIYAFNEESKKPVFSIDVPPPYASSGHLHIGHALHYTQFEIIARYKRMKGFNVYFAPCFDNNGLPTEKYVEEKFKITKNQLSRAEFRKLCLEESRKVEANYVDRVFKTLGHSYDWSLLYTTIDPEAQKVAQTSFLDLVEKHDCYRSEEPTIWCTKHHTALAQAEIEDVDRTSNLNYINFALENSDETICIATSRPELLPSCVGIFVHPEDERYKQLIGKKAIVPLFNQTVSIMADEKVDREFGTGIVMICTFGDKTDIEWWKQYKLPLKVSITPDGLMNELAGKFQGKKTAEAKELIIEELKEKQLLVKQEFLHQTVGTCWRCNTPVEFMVTKQWFIKTLQYKDALLKQAEKIEWYPSFYKVRFDDWTKNLQWDWCISRQRFYGVPIPVWYCEKCHNPVFPDKKDLPVDPLETKPEKKCSCGNTTFIPEQDVFDTWMTSSVSPQIAARWLEKPALYKKLAPMDLRPQSHDIIRTWAFYTILKSYLHFKSVPWKQVGIGTYVLDPKGKGMHKSKGNAVWADDLLKKYDVDALRYWVSTANWGEDLPFQEKELVAGKRFLTKMWNASKFVIMNLQEYAEKKPHLTPVDAWMMSKLNKMLKSYDDYFSQYKTGEAKKIAEQFFWNFCDNYLEIVKDRLYNPKNYDEEAVASAKYTLYHVLLAILKLFAPFVPHITEDIYQRYYKEKEGMQSIHVSPLPEIGKTDEALEKTGDIMTAIISAVRKYKTENKLSLKTEIEKLTLEVDKDIEQFLPDIKAVCNAKEVIFGSGDREVIAGVRIKIE
ncbi:valine--tRNA ligase [Candidatus Woesearchaeota archaeon]|nr:MAG: valine--tRNA ligase [Candidatus Woesearchaeota archaeon]